MNDRDEVIDDIFRRFRKEGGAAYIGEPVSVAEHMLLAAMAAENDGAGPLLIAAALLHDYGPLLHDLPEDAAEQGIDTRHEALGHAVLSRYFGPAVAEPVLMQVAAKRYLCAVDPKYMRTLSPASVLSLDLQGGPFTPEEAQEFERAPYWPRPCGSGGTTT
jgi:[1-hydroxy-2-(trimethylamino)ethyl]phosphonate dioxygenase